MTKIEYHEDLENPDRTGWYINDYDDFNAPPTNSTGPYDTQTGALRILRETTEPKPSSKRHPNDLSDSTSDDEAESV